MSFDFGPPPEEIDAYLRMVAARARNPGPVVLTAVCGRCERRHRVLGRVHRRGRQLTWIAEWEDPHLIEVKEDRRRLRSDRRVPSSRVQNVVALDVPPERRPPRYTALYARCEDHGGIYVGEAVVRECLDRNHKRVVL